MSTPKVSLTISGEDTSGKSVTVANVSYVNSSLSNATLLEFAQKLNALTTNTYTETTKVTKEVIDY